MILARYLHPRSAVSFWHTTVEPVDYDYDTLNDYYIDFRSKLTYKGPYDFKGIPLLNYFGAVGIQYNPCAIAQWGLGAFQCWKRNDEINSRTLFFNSANWLLHNLKLNTKGQGFLYYEFDFDAYGLKKPWTSALAQSQAISVLLRAYCETNNENYLTAAKTACAAMLSPVEDGGLLLRDGKNVFLEEVVADRPTAILDGMIFAVFGLRDYCLLNQVDDYAKKVLEECISTIERLLPKYDLGYWSRADLYAEKPPMPASNFYHGLHIAQLTVLSNITNKPIFDEYSKRWAKMQSSWLNCMNAFFKKVIFKFTQY